MHLSEGILSGPVLASGAVLAVVGTGLGLKKIDYDRIVHVAMLSSAFFVASLIHFKVGVTSVHLLLNGVVGLILGLGAVPAILTALILQAVLFGHGGITVLGVNCLIMAVPALVVRLLFAPLVMPSGKWNFAAGFMAGAVSVFLSAVLMAAALWFTNQDFMETCVAVVLAHIPVMVVEGLVTGYLVQFLVRVHPEMLQGNMAWKSPSS